MSLNLCHEFIVILCLLISKVSLSIDPINTLDFPGTLCEGEK